MTHTATLHNIKVKWKTLLLLLLLKHPFQVSLIGQWHVLSKISFAVIFPVSIDWSLSSLPYTLQSVSQLLFDSSLPLHIPNQFCLQTPCQGQREHLLMLMTFLGREKMQARQKKKKKLKGPWPGKMGSVWTWKHSGQIFIINRVFKIAVNLEDLKAFQNEFDLIIHSEK